MILVLTLLNLIGFSSLISKGMGICLGGGLGWLSGQHGFIVDNILSLRIVLADGSVVNASNEENAELFWACRGAGSSFGIVTEIVFRAYDQTEIFG
jgi:FAD/FMN-containing dehydrogenase